MLPKTFQDVSASSRLVLLSRYALALAIFTSALIVRLLLFPVADGLAFLTFYPATTLCFLFCGIGPGAVSVVLGGIAGFYIFFTPYWTFGHNVSGEIATLVYVLSSGLTGFIVIRLRGRESRIETMSKIEGQLRTIVRASPTALLLIDVAGRIRMINEKAEALFGYGQGELQDQPLEVLLEAHFRAGHSDLRQSFMQDRSSRAMGEGRLLFGLRKDGVAFPLEIGLSPMDSKGEHMVLAGVNDISERLTSMREMQERQVVLEKSNDELMRATQAKTRFLAAMSHELRTPLNGILGYARLLQMEGGLSAGQSGRVSSMLESGRHLLEMISCVLDLSEIESEHLTLKTAEVDPLAIVAACLDLVRPAAEAKGLALRVDVADSVQQTLTTDPTRVRQVLLNLLGNAVKFTKQGSVTVRLEMAANRSALRIEVRDTGPGISTEQRPHLFHEFDRLGIEAVAKIEGAGLGLALSARLAALMGGSVGYDDNPDGGSVFWLELPLVTAGTPQPEEKYPADQEIVRLTPAFEHALQVLVVDDMPMNRDIAEAFLRSAGHEVTCVDNGADAVTLAASTDFDAVVMDVRMPQMDGLEATRRIRAFAGRRGEVPIVALTAHAFTEQIKDCQKAGMDGHLAKPFDMESLLSAVGRAVVAKQRKAVGSGTGTVLPAEAIRPMESELPILNRAHFEKFTACFTPEKLAEHLVTFTERGQSLLRDLGEMDAAAGYSNEHADAAHALTGCAAMFGFERFAAASRTFERALQCAAAEAPTLAAQLCAAIEVTLKEISDAELGRGVGPGNALDAAAGIQADRRPSTTAQIQEARAFAP